MKIRLTKYGRRELVILTIISALAIAASVYTAWPGGAKLPYILARLAWTLIVVVPVLLVYGWALWFFRDPDRKTPQERGLLISPADGRVTDITPLGEDSALGCRGVQVGIFMSVFDVHVNRSPADATVDSVVHRPGLFLDARDEQAGEKNESATTMLTYNFGGQEYPIVIRQVAGLIARRIVTDLSPGQRLSRGERIGMIKFGSRMELMVPAVLGPVVEVKPGQHVKAGLTVLVRLSAEAGYGT